MDTSSAARLDAVVDLIGINIIVLIENARCARHRQDKGIGGHDVGLEAVIVSVLARVVVVDKGHRVALIVIIGSKALIVQRAPIATSKSTLHRIFQREVKHGRLDAVVLLGLVEPPAQGFGVTIPILAYRERGL